MTAFQPSKCYCSAAALGDCWCKSILSCSICFLLQNFALMPVLHPPSEKACHSFTARQGTAGQCSIHRMMLHGAMMAAPQALRSSRAVYKRLADFLRHEEWLTCRILH